MASIFKRVCILAFALAAPFPSAAAEMFGPIKSAFYGACLEAGSEDGIPNFEPCDRDKLAQIWFLTRADSRDAVYVSGARDVGPFDVNRQAVRSAAFPNRCLTAINDPDRRLSNKVLALRSCRGASDQRWEPNGGHDRLGYGGDCASATWDRLYIAPCGRNPARQALDVAALGRADNFDIGDFIADFPRVEVPEGHRFHDYAECREQNQNETTCFINMGNVQRYGFNLGTDVKWLEAITGGGDQVGPRLLDLGDQYSADRCALAHDRHFWYRPEESSLPHPNDYNFFVCLGRSIPTTTQERNALILGKLGFGGWFYVSSAAGIMIDGKLEFDTCVEEGLGILPPAGQPIESCWCRSLAVDTEAKLDAAEGLAQRQPTSELVGELAGRIEELRGDPVIINKRPDDPDTKVSCARARVRGYKDRIDELEARLATMNQALANARPQPRKIARGDTVWEIAVAEGVPDIPAYIRAFAALNPRTDPDLIYAGRSYLMPPRTAP